MTCNLLQNQEYILQKKESFRGRSAVIVKPAGLCIDVCYCIGR